MTYLFAAGLEPHLKLRVRGEIVQRRNLKTELLCLCEFAEANADRDEVLARATACFLDNVFRGVVNSLFVQNKLVLSIRPF